MSDAATTEFFGKLAYMSFLLGPDAPANAKKWERLSEQQREWFRASGQAEIDACASDQVPTAAADSE